ncbi:MAG: CDP-alcohol phosphatidyltransferase family protein [Nitrospirota bacterium]
MTILTIPNLITFVRIVILPVFVTALIYRRYNYALALFIAASVSDMLDGLLARLTDQKSALGAFLDPLADKILLVTSFILFAVYGWIPLWVTIAVISRDLIVVVGWFLFYLLYDTTKVEPSFIGKSAIAGQLLLIAYTLFSVTVPALPEPQGWMFWTVALLTIVSGLQYIFRGLKHAAEK